jgi:rhodanese-related sulfurtransferase
VRTPEEFAQGHVPGALNIPVSDLAARAGELMPFRDKEIVVYCQVGPRAYFVGMLMEQNGFTGVLDLQGHMHEWLSNGHPIQKLQ